mgnify:FL=1
MAIAVRGVLAYKCLAKIIDFVLYMLYNDSVKNDI